MEKRREIGGMELDTETILDALNDFERKPSPNVPPVLENLLIWIAKTGDTLYPWKKLKPLFICKLENVIQEYVTVNAEEVLLAPNVENVDFDDMRQRLVKAINTFSYAPFTIQRLCELVTDPKRYYKRSDKFMRGIEKNIMVVSTVSPNGKRQTKTSDFEKPTVMMNGIDTDCKNHYHDSLNDVAEQTDIEKSENVSKTNSNNLTESTLSVDSNTEQKTNVVSQESSSPDSCSEDHIEQVSTQQGTQEISSTEVENTKPANEEELTKKTSEQKLSEPESTTLPPESNNDDPADSGESGNSNETPETSLEAACESETKDPIQDNEMDQS
ncbi:serine/threonine-protein phosphatase 4 regulatory subunit 2-B-like [Anneissia japonica]|uniref:serine/threonine-protein phosphatase 4 regulatory subunit 2-B-like n=1 Tax=Anneissia japonica TaxID=1529436 RepID=UPI0014255ABF|nr:serine/threonine-protein phosphatase 4 regulatory subunit 2-B-like [Anneissia japonica]